MTDSISNDNLHKIYQRLTDLQHPDPIGCLARTKVITDFELQNEDKDHYGFFGFTPPHFKKFEFTKADADVNLVNEIGIVAMIDIVHHTRLGVEDQKTQDHATYDAMHVAFKWNERVAKQGKWSKKIRAWIGAVNRCRADISLMLGIFTEDENDHEFKRDKVDEQVTAALEHSRGEIQREQGPTSQLEEFLNSDEPASLFQDLQALRDQNVISEAELEYVTDGQPLSDLEIDREKAITTLMNMMDRV